MYYYYQVFVGFRKLVTLYHEISREYKPSMSIRELVAKA